MLRGLDAGTTLTPYATKIKAAGFDHVGRYLKNLRLAEVTALHAAGLGVWLIYETTATRALFGDAAGAEDGLAAKQQAMALGVPDGTAIYATVDTDVPLNQLGIVRAYMLAFYRSLAGQYRLGIYACGAVLQGNADIAVPWLAGAMGWAGSRAYEASSAWAMKQGADLNGRAGVWNNMTWPALGFDYDPNVIGGHDFGPWMAAGQASVADQPLAPAPPAEPVNPMPDLKIMQAYLGVTVDGLWGDDTANAAADYYGGWH